MSSFSQKPLGALPQAGDVLFRLWAPRHEHVDLLLEDDSGDEAAQELPMEAAGHGYFERFVEGARAGARYRYRPAGEGAPSDPLPDPASRCQPEGVHGPSQVVDPAQYTWQSGTWTGRPQRELVFYELHVGAFTPEGTFDAARRKLRTLKELGITAVELMPVAAFPGERNWGYDPAAFFAPARAYGAPDDLRALVDAAHREGLAVFLDVIYNHFGPDGAYGAVFAPFFTEKHHTPWGDAINLDDEGSAGVRHFFIQNALMWLEEYRIDGLRLDATFALYDDSETHFLAELSEAVDALSEESGFRRYLVAEDHRNLARVYRPRAEGGYGLDAGWIDDFHHQMRNLTAGDTAGYFSDFAGTTAPDLARTLREGWFFSGQHSDYFGHARGTDPTLLSLDQFVFYIQNHDQIGNRPQGDRLTDDIGLPLYRAASALLLLAPQLPLVFMGQEWAAASPFQYFTDHNDELGRLVREGRRKEFEDFEGFAADVPDPQSPETFQRSKLDWAEREQAPHAGMLRLYRELLHVRPELGDDFAVEARGERALTLRRGAHHVLVALAPDQTLPLPASAHVLFSTEDERFAPDGEAPHVEDASARFATPGALLVRHT